MEILVFGDSVAYGAWDGEGGWVQRLRKSTDAEIPDSETNDLRVYNLSISGDTTGGLLKRFDSETGQRLGEDTFLTIVFAIGLNDSAFFMDRNANWVSRKRFAENLKSLVAIAKKYTRADNLRRTDARRRIKNDAHPLEGGVALQERVCKGI